MIRAAQWLAVVGVVLLSVFGAARLWVLASLPALNGREPVRGLADSVVVLWDSLAVPHVLASSDADAFVALGYLHAHDRLWQLELLRHAALGRLSELFGPRMVAADRGLRELEISDIAARRLARIAPESRRVLESYALGVNSWIDHGPRPLELRLLRHAPEPWEPWHSLAVGVLQAWDLRTTGDEIELAAVAADLGVERALDLLAEPAEDRAPRRSAENLPARTAPRSARRHSPTPREPADWWSASAAASNAWAIAGQRTASGKPILANDPHLTLRAPSIWYLVGVHAPTYEVVGATIPGVPVVVLGHTRAVAWGFTNAMVDDVDYVAEELSPDSARYQTPAGWLPIEVVAETIHVRGEGAVAYARRRTARGPLTVREYLGGSRAYSIRWVAQDGGADEVGALLGMARATRLAAFSAALRRFRSPEQSVVYADSSGRIAYFLAGRVPVRAGGASPFPVAGPMLAGDPWLGWVDDGALPTIVDPVQGWIATANNRMVGDEYPHFLSRHYDLPYRAQRIEQLLRQDTIATYASVSRHQMDVIDLFGRQVRELIAGAALSLGRADLADRLRGWDGSMRPEAPEAALYWRWYGELARMVYDETPAYQPTAPLHGWLARRRSAWFDDGRTAQVETLQLLARRALSEALAARAAVPWRDVHSTVMRHPLGRLAVVGRLLGLDIGPLHPGGSNYTVNSSMIVERHPPYTSDYGPSLRHVVDLADPNGSGGFVLATGQSGHAASRHYRDQSELWLHGDLWVLPLDPARVRSRDTLVLDPGEPSREKKTPQGFPWGATLARHRAP